MPVEQQNSQRGHKSFDLAALYSRLVREGRVQDPAPAIENEDTDGSSKTPTPPTGLWQGSYGMIQGSGRGPQRTTTI